jgi:uncharacterized protein (DUF1697 family)
MTTHIALLRAINVGGRNLVSMAALRAMLTDIGFTDVQTLLQSGNVVFTDGGKSEAEFESLLEIETEKQLGLTIHYMVRSAEQWLRVVESNPFPTEAERDPGHLLVMFLKHEPKPDDIEALRSAIKGPEVVEAIGKQLYVVYPDGMGPSKFTGAIIERKLGCPGTGRNWNTVLKLAALAKA